MEGHSLTFRKFALSDAQRISELANNKKIAMNLRDNFPHPYSLKDAKNFVREITLKKIYVRAICYEDQIIGAVGFYQDRDVMRYSAEIGYWIGEAYWNKGFCTQMLRLIIPEYLRYTDVLRIYAIVFASNVASEKVLEKLGFTMEGTLRSAIYKNDQFQDARIWSLLKNEVEDF